VAWSLENAGQPVLERARERLVTLTAADPRRVIRLVVRRCRPNLVEIRPGRADVRPFFKHSLAKQGVEVFLIDRKREAVTARPGDFLYGTRLPQDFPLDLYRQKRQRWGQEEPTILRQRPEAGQASCGKGSSRASSRGRC
jgi:hypothetical protein